MVCATLSAQQYQFVYYTPRDGLVNSRVKSILQDSRGRMHFITFGGLSVYDGIRFRNYSQQDGLAAEVVNDILEITPDSFLIATNIAFLNTLVKGKVGDFHTIDGFCPVINKFLKSKDGTIYIIADEGLFKLEGNKFIHLPLLNQDNLEIGGNLDRITEWNQYLIMLPWNFNQKYKLIIYDKEMQKVTGAIRDQFFISTEVAPTGELLLSSTTKLQVLDSQALKEGKILFRTLVAPFDHPQLNNSLLYNDPGNTLWFLRKNEVHNITRTGEIITFSGEHGLRSSNFSSVFVDREGITWISSDGNGVVKLAGTNVQIMDDFIPGIKNNFSAISQYSDTTWLFNRTNHSFYRFHQNKLTTFSLPGNQLAIVHFFTLQNCIYFHTGPDLFRIENKNLPSSFAHPQKVIPGSFPVRGYASGIADPYGHLIQAALTDDSSFSLLVLDHQRLKMKLPLSYLGDQMAIDRENNLWVPTRDNHLVSYSLHPDDPDHYLQLKYDLSQHVAGINPRSMATDSTGNLWLGTRHKGICCLVLKDQQFQNLIQVTTDHGLTDNFNYHLYCDPQNHIWAGSQTGLDKISYHDGEIIIENVTKSKNIFQGIYKVINVEKDVIWALTSTGDILMISENRNRQSLPLPTLYITTLLVNDLVFDNSVTRFRHDQNNFAISVAAPTFVDEKSIQFSYLLKGSRKNTWSEPSNRGDFVFNNLNDGQYELLIRAQFPAKMYPVQEIKYAFRIMPPFYKTWWFASLLILTILLISGWIIRYYYSLKFEHQRRILERKQAIEKERTRIATDMHDDLGAGLSRIKFLSETIGIKKQQHLPAEEEITSIRRYAHEMIDKMGEIVWALNEKNDSLSDLLSYTRAYAMEYLAENGIACQIDKLPVIKPMMVNGEFRRNVYLSVKEALHNVIKHARASKVIMKFEANDHLWITIRDDGVGFNPGENHSFGNGISNIKKRMAEIGGEMKIMQDHGTVIILTAPLNQ